MSIKNKEPQNKSFLENLRDRPVTAAAAAAGTIAVAAVAGMGAASYESGSHDARVATTTESSQFTYVTDLPQEVQDALLQVQAYHDKDMTMAPDHIPSVTLNQTGESSFFIVGDGTGLAEQATQAYRVEHKLQDGQETPESVVDSITVTTKALSQRNHIENQSDTIHESNEYKLIELKDAEGTDLAVISPAYMPTVN